MAPNFRNSNRRQNRTGPDIHDIMEGIPVRQWRRDFVTIAPPPTQESTASQNDIWAVELPHGMPKDSHLLPQHSQDLLRAARSGRIYKRPAPVEEEEADAEVVLGEKPEKKEDESREKGFTAKAWKQIARHVEAPDDMNYLAKRRKGLLTVSQTGAPVPTLTKATVRKLDAAGNSYVQDVIVPNGEQVEGEVISTTIIPDPAAIDGLVQPVSAKKKGVPTKSKSKKSGGPGRGKKKKPIAPTSVPESVPVNSLAQSVEGNGVAAASDVSSSIDKAIFDVGVDTLQAIKTENGTESDAPPPPGEDTEMAEGSQAASDDEDGDEGDDDEESVSAQGSPSKPPRTTPPHDLPQISDIPGLGSKDTEMSDIDDLPGPPLPKLETTEGKSGSPLKNVALATPSARSPTKSPERTQEPILDAVHTQEEITNEPAPSDIPAIDAVMQNQVVETAPSELPLPPPEPTIAEVVSTVEERRAEEEEEEMLLDILENTNNSTVGAPQTSQEPVIPPAVSEVQEKEIVPPEVAVPEVEKEESPRIETSAPAPVQESAVEAVEVVEAGKIAAGPTNDDDAGDDGHGDFPDLLGGLMEQVKEPPAAPPATEPSIVEEQPQKEEKEIETVA